MAGLPSGGKIFCADSRVQGYADKIKHIKLKHLKFYGYIHCDISRYEEYCMIALISEFLSEVPCFFDSYDHLHFLFTNRFNECDMRMIRLRSDLLEYPSAPLQAKLAAIIHDHFCNLPWLNL